MAAAGLSLGLFVAVSGGAPATAQTAPPGMIPYDHPVYKNGKRVLWHGADEAADATPATSDKPAAKAAPASHALFTVVADGDDSCAARMVEELSAALRAGGLRSKVAVGRTGPASLSKYMAGDDADLAIAPIDAIAEAAGAAGWRDKAPLIARLGRETIEIVASKSIADIAALEGRKVAVGPATGSGEAVAAHLFHALGINPKFVAESVAQGLLELNQGKIDAVFAVGETHSHSVGEFGKSGGFHLLAAPTTPALAAAYAPVRLTHADRPNLIGADEKVDTLSAGMALFALDAAPGGERAQRDGAVIAPLFEKYAALLQAGTDPNWREVNLAAAAPGWPRLEAAKAWLEAHGAPGGDKLATFRDNLRTLPPTGPAEGDIDRLYRGLMALQGDTP